MSGREYRQGGRYLESMTRPAKATDVEIKKRLIAIEFARGSVARLAPDRNLADELIAERRAEAGVAGQTSHCALPGMASQTGCRLDK
jgi:hypothetical protein